MNNKEVGQLGEKYAEHFLISQDYHVIEKNFNWREGEIDIIAFENYTGFGKNKTIVFIEVKTRTSDKFGEPQDAVGFSKKNKIVKTVLHFFSLLKAASSLSWRIDVIAVKLDRNYKLKEINHIKNVFDG